MAFNIDKFVKEKTKTITVPSGGFDINKFIQEKGFGGKADLTTSQGLYNVAIQKGLKEKADRILSTKGEETKKIFSGGFISDIFDGLNALQYGVTGVLKGKGFTEGVKTRQSFSDKDALGEYGLPGVVGGIAMDIAVDPLTYVAPWTVLKKIGIAPKIIKGAEITKESRIGQWFARKLIYRFGQDPVYKELAERTIKNIATGQQNLIELAKPLTQLDPATQRIIASARKAGRLGELPPEVLSKAKPAFDELDKLGKEAVEVGLLPAETWAKNLGTYLPRLYKTKELPTESKRILGIFPTKPKRIELSRFMRIKDIPEEIRKSMGEILEAGYPTAKGLIQIKSAVENAKFFNEVAVRFGEDIKTISTIGEDILKQLPETKKLGQLSGKFVPFAIYDDIQEIIRVPSDVEKGLKKVVGGFKFAKVILNPATHARNVVSNAILNWWKLGLGPWRVDIYAETVRQMAKGGKYIDEAKTAGYNLNTFAANELKSILNGPEGFSAGQKLGIKWGQIANKLGDIYQGEENFAKLAAYIFKRKKGLGVEEAWKAAESATFNYAQVTLFIRRLRESIWGYPFITFTYKATPIVVETIAKHPGRVSVFGKIKNDIENLADIKTTERERASEPAWIRDGFYIKLPIKDKHGRSSYFDLTYIIPFGDLMAGNYFTRQIKRETGLPESLPETFAEKSPFFNLLKELSRNQDFYGDRIWNESDSTEKQLGDLMRHLLKLYSPPLISDQLPGGYMREGKRRIKGIAGAIQPKENIGQQRTLMQELLRNVGLKIQPIDADIQETYMEWEKKKALQELLGETGIIQTFERPYIPKR